MVFYLLIKIERTFYWCYEWVISGTIITKPEDFDNYVVKNGAGVFTCMVCSYNLKNSRDARNHVESKHFPNTFTYRCLACDKTFGTNWALTRHKYSACKK